MCIVSVSGASPAAVPSSGVRFSTQRCLSSTSERRGPPSVSCAATPMRAPYHTVMLERQAVAQLAATCRCACMQPMHAGVPESEICWFLQTIYSAPSGLPLWINSSLSTVRCNIAVLFTFMMTQLECALIDKELDCFNGNVAEGESLLSQHCLLLQTAHSSLSFLLLS